MKAAHINANLKVLLLDTDYYALQAINSYLAWDRRTRVTSLAESPEDMWRGLDRMSAAELPDAVLIDADHMGGEWALRDQLDRLKARVPKAMIICLAQMPLIPLVEVALAAGARGFLLKNEVQLHIAWAIVYALDFDFIVTRSIARDAAHLFSRYHIEPTPLPGRRQYPELKGRIRQAIELSVVQGMPAHLAADEMGISLHTIRSYIKEGYRILESHDETEYPDDMSPQERAFMRLTGFEDFDAVPQRPS